jgi:hypothetical protein
MQPDCFFAEAFKNRLHSDKWLHYVLGFQAALKIVVFLSREQGDRMRWRNNRPRDCPTHFLSQMVHVFSPWKT